MNDLEKQVRDAVREIAQYRQVCNELDEACRRVWGHYLPSPARDALDVLRNKLSSLQGVAADCYVRIREGES